jgi:atypical dual specificity phosphatase
MAQPTSFSWIDQPLLAGMGRPESVSDLTWLRKQGIEIVISLTEEALRRDWVNEVGLMLVHIPVQDMEAPSEEQLDRAISTIKRAVERKMGVVVHCGAGLGRTGVVLACYLVSTGMSAANAMARVRRIRPGSIETPEQEAAVESFERRRRS